MHGPACCMPTPHSPPPLVSVRCGLHAHGLANENVGIRIRAQGSDQATTRGAHLGTLRTGAAGALMRVSMYTCVCRCMHASVYVCMRVYMYACECLCMHVSVYVCMRVYMYACVCICMHANVYVCMRVSMYACECLCMHASVYVCMRVYMYAC